MSEIDYNQWSTVRPFLSAAERNAASWIPREERDRIAAYQKYDEMYWNDPRQYTLRVLEGEEPIYIPNARTVVDTTAYFLLKGLEITCSDKKTQTALDAFLKRETFYSRFHTAKHTGVARGDFIFHLTGNPRKGPGRRLSLVSVDPSSVYPIYDEHEPDKMTGCHIAIPYEIDSEPNKQFLRRLTYRLVEDELGNRRVSREEAIWELEAGWLSNKMKLFRQILPLGYLDERITSIPIYWFKNRHWDGESYGSSELRGLEVIASTVSQGSTDVSASLSLEGLGVYATDGGRPVDDGGEETEWEVAPGKVMEVPQGSYFRRVEGVGSITPAKDQIDYLEEKLHEATGLSDVALGTVEAQVASSGIALAIRFMPTLAKLETRDQLGIDVLTQMFFDWKTWHEVFEREPLDGDIIPVIGDKLPSDRTAKLNELNNMLDRRVISTKFYRAEMEKLGYEFPRTIEDDIDADLERMAKASAPQQTSPDEEESEIDSDTDGDTLENQNSSNNRNRPNESSGTEAQQTRDA